MSGEQVVFFTFLICVIGGSIAFGVDIIINQNKEILKGLKKIHEYQ